MALFFKAAKGKEIEDS